MIRTKEVKQAESEILWVEHRLHRLGVETTDSVKIKIAQLVGHKLRLFVILMLKGHTYLQAYMRAQGDKYRVTEVDDKGNAHRKYVAPPSQTTVYANMKRRAYRDSRDPRIQGILLEHRKTAFAQADAPPLAWGNRQVMAMVLKCKKEGDVKNALTGLKLLGDWNNWGKKTTSESINIDAFLLKLRQTVTGGGSNAIQQPPQPVSDAQTEVPQSEPEPGLELEPEEKEQPRLVQATVVPQMTVPPPVVVPQPPPIPQPTQPVVVIPEATTADLPPLNQAKPKQIIHVPIKTPVRGINGNPSERLGRPAIRKTRGDDSVRRTPDSE